MNISTLELDRDPPRYAAGEPIAGVVRIDARDRVKVREVTITLRWETHGKGDSDSDDAVEYPLLGEHEFFGKSEHPFSIPTPHAPLSYNGHLLKVQWAIELRLDRPWAIDEKRHLRFELV